MPRTKINKAEKIRETLEKLGPDVRTKDVIATLAEQKITVAPAQVSNIKAVLRGPKKGKRGIKGTNGHGDLISLSGLQAAKKLVESLGSVEAAQHAARGTSEAAVSRPDRSITEPPRCNLRRLFLWKQSDCHPDAQPSLLCHHGHASQHSVVGEGRKQLVGVCS